MISSSPDTFKSLVDLVRALKARLGDSQSNLKPIAARNIALILGSVDAIAQAKLGKIVYGSLIAVAMSDNKKLMRDASMDALNSATMKSEIDGGGVNKVSMEPFMSAFATESNELGQKVRLMNLIYFLFFIYLTQMIKFFCSVRLSVYQMSWDWCPRKYSISLKWIVKEQNRKVAQLRLSLVKQF